MESPLFLRRNTLLWIFGLVAIVAAAIILLAPGASAWTSGPDACNYSGADSAAVPGGPVTPAVFNWEDISATGTGLPFSSWSPGIDVNIPFTFRYCGFNYNTVRTEPNGFICFDTPGFNCDYNSAWPGWPGPVPSQYLPYPSVLGYFSYLQPQSCTGGSAACSRWAVTGLPGNREFIYMQKNVPIGSGTWVCPLITCYTVYPSQVSYEIKLFEVDNCIEIHYLDAYNVPGSYGRSVSGIQENWPQGTAYFDQSNAAKSLQATAVRFCQPAPQPPPVRCPGPANDCFNSPAPIGATPYSTSQYTWGATREVAFEPRTCAPYDIGASVWFNYTPSTSGFVTVDTYGSNYWTGIAAYTGNALGSLTSVGCSASCCSGNSITFACNAGTQYRIQVTGAYSGTGQAYTQVSTCGPLPPCPGPVNNCFQFSKLVATTPYTDIQSNGGGTMEPLEQRPCSLMEASIWYNWTADATGRATVDTIGSNHWTSVAVYTGNSLSTLNSVACKANCCSAQSVSFACTAGVTYHIQVGGAVWWWNPMGLNTVHISPCLPAPPAACGYMVDNNAPYQWEEIDPLAGGAGTRFQNYYYSSNVVVPPTPMVFNLCGQNYDRFWLAGDGNICLDRSDPLNPVMNLDMRTPWWGAAGGTNCEMGWATTNIPDANTASAAVFGMWSLTNPGACSWWNPPTNCPIPTAVYQIKGAAPNRVLIYEIREAPIIANWWGPPSSETFEIKLFETTNCIEVHYKDVAPDSLFSNWYPMASGFQGANGAAGYEFKFAPPGASPPNDFRFNQRAWAACPFGAARDRILVNEDQPAGTGTFDVLSNDNGGGFAMTVTAFTRPTHGTMTGPVGGNFTYTPYPDYVGEDSFNYTMVNTNRQVAIGIVNITVTPLNDRPTFTGPLEVKTTPVDGAYNQVYATGVGGGPLTALDELSQNVTFERINYTNPGLFATPPTLKRILTATSTSPVMPPNTGGFALLSFEPSGAFGQSLVCFRARDDGGTTPATTVRITPPRTDPGYNVSLPQCFKIYENGPPVAYFEADSPRMEPGQSINFNACPRAIPACSYDVDGFIQSYRWDFGDGSIGYGLSNSHVFAGPGTYLVRLTVTDDSRLTSVMVRSIRVGWDNQAAVLSDGDIGTVPPIADAGGNFSVIEGTHVFVVGSQHGGNEQARFQWTKLAGPDLPLQNMTSPTLSFVAPALQDGKEIVFLFSLRVSQGPLIGQPDYAVVTVVSRNHAPQANAGGAIPGDYGSTVTLDGSHSTDADGNSLTYKWERVSGPAVTLTGTGAVVSFTAPATTAVLQFRLTVSDGTASSTDIATVYVQPAEASPQGVRMGYEVKQSPGGGADIQFVALGATDATWQFGDGSAPVTGMTVTHHYAVGSYDATMTVGGKPFAHHFDIAAPKSRDVEAKASPVTAFALAAGALALLGAGVSVLVVRRMGKK